MSDITDMLEAILSNANDPAATAGSTDEKYLPLNGVQVIRAALSKMGVGVNEISEGRSE